jgi:hypothetical protein
MKKRLFILLIFAITFMCSVAAVAVITAECSGSRTKYFEFAGRLNSSSPGHASAEGVKGGLDRIDQAKTNSQKEKEFDPPISLSKGDRIFVLLVFVSSMVAAIASIISMIIKTKRLKFGRRNCMIGEYEE